MEIDEGRVNDLIIEVAQDLRSRGLDASDCLEVAERVVLGVREAVLTPPSDDLAQHGNPIDDMMKRGEEVNRRLHDLLSQQPPPAGRLESIWQAGNGGNSGDRYSGSGNAIFDITT